MRTKIKFDGMSNLVYPMPMVVFWNKEITTNEKIGQLFNMSYSAISHCVKIFKEKMNTNKKVKTQFETVNSQFKRGEI